MRLLLLICVSLLFWVEEGESQVIVPDSRNYLIELGPQVFYYADPSGSFKPADFRTDLFQPGDETYLGDGRNNWLFFALKNPTSEVRETLVWLKDGFYVDRIDVYIAREGEVFRLLAKLNGSDDFDQRLYPSNDVVLPFRIPAHDGLKVLIRLDHRSSISFAPVLVSPRQYEEIVRVHYAFYGLLLGVICVSVIYNLLLYFRLREPSLLYYSGYLAGLCILFIMMSGFGIEYIWSGRFQYISINLGASLVGCMIVQYCRVFLKIAEFSPWLNRIMLTTYWTLAPMVILSFAKMPPYFTDMIYLADLISIMTAIAAIAVGLGKGYRPARMFALAWAAFLAGSLTILATALGLVSANVFSQYGMQIGALVQTVVLAVASADQLAEKSRQLRALSKKRQAELEAEVAIRTQAMREIVDNVTSGFFIIDRDLLIQDGFTTSCLQILGSRFAANQTIGDCLTLPRHLQRHLSLAIQQIFEDTLPPSVSLSSLPNRLPIEHGVVSLEARVIREAGGEVAKILFTVTDVTALVVAEHRKKIDDALIGILRQRSAFTRFVLDFDASLVKLREYLEHGSQRELRQVLHTVKGNASIFRLDELVHLIHDAEGAPIITASHLDTIDRAMGTFFQEHLAELGFDRASMSEEMCQINKSRVLDFQVRCQQSKSLEGLQSTALDFCRELRLKPAREVLIPLDLMARRVAENLGKKVDVILGGQNVLIDFDQAEPVLRNLAHLIRNAISHGIEDEEQRLDRGKAGRGTLGITVHDTYDSYRFEVSDDGSGIDPELVAQAALKKKAVTEEDLAGMNDVEKQWLIFTASLSTAREVTEIAGRGLGMEAVLEGVHEAQAYLEMESVVGVGTRFIITIPKQRTDTLVPPPLLSQSVG